MRILKNETRGSYHVDVNIQQRDMCTHSNFYDDDDDEKWGSKVQSSTLKRKSNEKIINKNYGTYIHAEMNYIADANKTKFILGK